ncbi:MAG: succinate dehydrogenase, hydrophobic membrane anchor protein [Caulobacteraceae bacterium]
MAEGYRTPLGRARGLGSAKRGVASFIAERVTAVALAPLSLWAVWSGVVLARGDFAIATAWMRAPVNATLLALFALISFHHTQIGMRVIVEDYIARPSTKAVLLVANLFICWAGAALTIVCILRIALGLAPAGGR